LSAPAAHRRLRQAAARRTEGRARQFRSDKKKKNKGEEKIFFSLFLRSKK
jgi:hypothetical protein